MPKPISLENFERYLERNSFDRKPYQFEGVRWLLNNEVNGVAIYAPDKSRLVRGGLIADEMGLGKTIQIIGTILCNFQRRTLIVLPYIILVQWRDIIFKTLGHKPLVYHGSRKKKITLEQLKSAPIVLTTYGNVALYRKRRVNLLYDIKWGRLVLDESHHIKNHRTASFKGFEEMKSSIKWLITGTPVHNVKNDLIRPLTAIGVPIQYCKLAFNFKSKNQEIREQYYKHFSENLMLRRTKADVGIAIPPCAQHTIVVPWKYPSVELASRGYHELVFKKSCASKVIKWLAQQSEKRITLPRAEVFEYSTIEMLQDSFLQAYEKFVLPAIMRSRQLCFYPRMIKRSVDSLFYLDPVTGKSTEDLKWYNSICSDTSKIDAVVDQLHKNKDNGNLKIVFTTFHMEADLIQDQLLELGFSCEIVDGRVANSQRNFIFALKPQVLILQIVAACEGLNLQSYSEVYITSPHWNPAVEAQAIARCHRIGQQKPVTVYKYVMETVEVFPSIDDYCMYLQSHKTQIAGSMISGTGIPDNKKLLQTFAFPEEDNEDEDGDKEYTTPVEFCIEDIEEIK